MCRSIKTLREPYAEQVTSEDVRAAALQYVRKISGFRAPAAHNAEAFNTAVEAVAQATAHLLDRLEVRAAPARGGASSGAAAGQSRSSRSREGVTAALSGHRS